MGVNLGMFQVAAGQTILADHINSALLTGIPKFANVAARDAQWPSPFVGSMCYLIDLNYLQVFDAPITGGPHSWRVMGSLRMGFATMGSGQVIPNNSVHTLVKLTYDGGAANKAGRATWNADGSVTVPLNGAYSVVGDLTWPSNTTGDRRVYVKKYTAGAWTFDGVAGGVAEVNQAGVGSSVLRMSVTAHVQASVGDKIGMFALHSATAALTLPASGSEMAGLSMHLLGAD